MNAAKGGQSDESLDAFLDDRLDAGRQGAFRDRLASDPALAAELEGQRRVDHALAVLFVAPRYPGLPGDVLRLPTPADRAAPARAAVSQTRGVIWGSLIGAALFCLTWFLYTQLVSPDYSLNRVSAPHPAPALAAPPFSCSAAPATYVTGARTPAAPPNADSY